MKQADNVFVRLFTIILAILLITQPCELSADMLRPLSRAEQKPAPKVVEAEIVEEEEVPPSDDTQSATGSPGTQIALIGETTQYLPALLDPALAKFSQAASSPDGIADFLLRNEELIEGLANTTVFRGNKDAVKEAIGTLLTAEAGPEANACARKLKSALNVSGAKPEATFLLVNLILGRRARNMLEPAFVGLICELLSDIDGGELSRYLGEDGLLSSNAGIQQEAFGMLFDRYIIRPAREIHEARGEDPTGSQQNILRAQLVLRQASNILADISNPQFAGLRAVIIEGFAREARDEVVNREKAPPVMAELMNYCGIAARDFFHRVIELTRTIEPDHQDKARRQSERQIAQSAETLISFACLQWPDYFFPKLKARYQHSRSVFMRSAMLYSMAFAVHGAREAVSDPDAVKFVVREAINLCGEKEAQDRPSAILESMPEVFVSYVSAEGRYQALPENRRRALFDTLVRLGVNENVQGGRMRVLPFLAHDIASGAVSEVQMAGFFKNFLNDAVVTQVTSGDPRILQGFLNQVIDNFAALRGQGILDDTACQRLMAAGGFPAIQRSYNRYKALAKTDPGSSVAMLMLSARAVSRYSTKTPDEIAYIGSMVNDALNGYLPDAAASAGALKQHLDSSERIKSLTEEQGKLAETSQKLTEALDEQKTKVDEARKKITAAQEWLKAEEKAGRLAAENIESAITNLNKRLARLNEDLEAAQTPAKRRGINEEIADTETQIKKRQTELKDAKEAAANEAFKRQGVTDTDKKLLAWYSKEKKRVDEIHRSIEGKALEINAEREKRAAVNLEACKAVSSENASALRLLLAGPSAAPDTIKHCYDELVKPETQDLYTALAAANKPNFPGGSKTAVMVEKRIAQLLVYEFPHSEFAAAVENQVIALTEIAKLGLLPCRGDDDPVVTTVARHLVNTYNRAGIEFGWGRPINNARLHFLATVATDNNTPQEIRRKIQNTLNEHIFMPWFEEHTSWDTRGKFCIDTRLLLVNLQLVLAAPAVSTQRLETMAFGLASKVNVMYSRGQINPQNPDFEITQQILAALRARVKGDVAVEGVNVSEIIGQALANLERAKSARPPQEGRAAAQVAPPALRFQDLAVRGLLLTDSTASGQI